MCALHIFSRVEFILTPSTMVYHLLLLMTQYNSISSFSIQPRSEIVRSDYLDIVWERE